MPGFPVLPHLPELAQTHVHRVSDATQLSYSLSSPSPPALNLSQASGSFPMSQFFPSGGQSSAASASVLPVNIQDWFPLELTGFISVLSKGFSSVFSSTTIWKRQFFGTQPSNSHKHTYTGKTTALTTRTLSVKWCLCFLICCLGLS